MHGVVRRLPSVDRERPAPRLRGPRPGAGGRRELVPSAKVARREHEDPHVRRSDTGPGADPPRRPRRAPDPRPRNRRGAPRGRLLRGRRTRRRPRRDRRDHRGRQALLRPSARGKAQGGQSGHALPGLRRIRRREPLLHRGRGDPARLEGVLHHGPRGPCSPLLSPPRACRHFQAERVARGDAATARDHGTPLPCDGGACGTRHARPRACPRAQRRLLSRQARPPRQHLPGGELPAPAPSTRTGAACAPERIRTMAQSRGSPRRARRAGSGSAAETAPGWMPRWCRRGSSSTSATS